MSLFKLFANSPFKALNRHMEKVILASSQLNTLFDTLQTDHQGTSIQDAVSNIRQIERDADFLKNEIRDHLPNSLFMPIARRDLLALLHAQDQIADKVLDVAITLSLRPLKYPDYLQNAIAPLLENVMDSCSSAQRLVGELEKLLETGFGGSEADKVFSLIRKVEEKEENSDDTGIAACRVLFSHEEEFGPVDTVMWYQMMRKVGHVADAAETVASSIRLLIAKA